MSETRGCLKLLDLAMAILAIQNRFHIHMGPLEHKKDLERFGEPVLTDSVLHELLRASVGAATFAGLERWVR